MCKNNADFESVPVVIGLCAGIWFWDTPSALFRRSQFCLGIQRQYSAQLFKPSLGVFVTSLKHTQSLCLPSLEGCSWLVGQAKELSKFSCPLCTSSAWEEPSLSSHACTGWKSQAGVPVLALGISGAELKLQPRRSAGGDYLHLFTFPGEGFLNPAMHKDEAELATQVLGSLMISQSAARTR